MKYICIHTNHEQEKPCPYIIEVGDILTLDYVVHHEGQDWLVWIEIPGWGWQPDAFSPLSDIDETEMVREYNTQKELV